MSKYNEIENERNALQTQVFDLIEDKKVLKSALKEALQFLECTDGRRGCLMGCVVNTHNWVTWHKLVR